MLYPFHSLCWSTVKECTKRIVMANKYLTSLIDSNCMTLIKIEFEILYNYMWQ